MRPLYFSFTFLLFLFAISPADVPSDPIKKKEVVYTNESFFIEGDYHEIILKTANGCGIGNFLIPLKGDSAKGIPPMLSSINSDYPFGSRVLDTIPGNEIKGIAFQRMDGLENSSIVGYDNYGNQLPYVVITDVGLFSYLIPSNFAFYNPIDKSDSLFIPNIVEVAHQITINNSDPIVLVTKNSVYELHYYSYPSLSLQYSLAIDYKPELLEIEDDALYVVGQDSSENYALNHYATSVHSLVASYPLNQLVSNPQELIEVGDSVFILSSPGDSIVMLTTVNLDNGNIIQSIVHPISGARATHNEYRDDRFFTFQPKADTSIANLNQKIIVLDPVNNQQNNYNVNLQLDYFKQPEEHPLSFGYFQLDWVGAAYNDQMLDSFYFAQNYGNTIFEFAADGHPDFVNATYGCWVGNENLKETEKIKFEMYPNPASSYFLINLTGLARERPYTFELIDNSGKMHHSGTLYAYQKIQIPIDRLANGVYYFHLNTGKNTIAQKLIIQ